VYFSSLYHAYYILCCKQNQSSEVAGKIVGVHIVRRGVVESLDVKYTITGETLINKSVFLSSPIKVGTRWTATSAPADFFADRRQENAAKATRKECKQETNGGKKSLARETLQKAEEKPKRSPENAKRR
jgi:hypothetical protein